MNPRENVESQLIVSEKEKIFWKREREAHMLYIVAISLFYVVRITMSERQDERQQNIVGCNASPIEPSPSTGMFINSLLRTDRILYLFVKRKSITLKKSKRLSLGTERSKSQEKRLGI